MTGAKTKHMQPSRVRVFPFLLDVREEDSCLVRHESYGEGADAWHVFTIAQVMSSRKQPLKPIITLHGFIHQKIRETMRSQRNIDIEFVLDETLTHLNDFWHNQFSKTDIKLISSSTLIVGMARGSKLCIADRGSSFGNMVMMHDSKKKIVPVISPRPNGSATSDTLFESIVCGALPVGARAVLGTSLIRNLGRNDVFMQLLSKRTTNLSEVWDRMRRKFGHKGNPHCAGVLLESYSHRPSIQDTKSQQSLSDYVAKPPQTVLAPLARVQKFFRVVINFLTRIYTAIARSLSRFFTWLSRVTPRWLRPPQFFVKGCCSIQRTISSFFRRITTHRTSQAVHTKTKTVSFRVARTFLLSLLWIATRIFSPFRSFVRAIGKRFSHLSRGRKLALVSALVAIVLFFVGLSVTRYLEGKRNAAALVDATIEEFSQHLESAESKLIFGDSIGARHELNQAESLLAALPREAKEHASVIATLDSQLQELRTEILKEKDIVLTAIAFSADSSQGQRRVFISHGQLISNDDLHIMNVGLEKQISFSSSLTDSSVISYSDEGLLFITDSTVSLFDSKRNVLSNSEFATDGVGTLVAAQQYGPRLYGVTGNGNILRHAPSASGFARGTTWLREESPLQDPTDMVIDGNVYVLDSGSRVLKFFKGTREPFTDDSIDPPLSKAARIWTDADSEFLYVLEPSRRRLVILNKRGVMQLQYVFDKVPEDFAISEDKQTGYIVVGHNVYSFVLTHVN